MDGELMARNVPTPEQEDDEPSFLQEVRSRFREAHDHASKWREEARENYRFYAGHQWSDDDLAKLQEQQRPAITFNRAGVLIDAVLGHENNNRKEVRYIPRTMGDAAVNEQITEGAKFFRDQCDADHEESDAFRDSLISGMGWTNTRLSDEENPEYDLVEERVDPLEMLWDPSSQKPNLADARYLFRVKKMSRADIRAIWPDWDGIEEGDSAIAWDDDDVEPGNANPRDSYKDPAGTRNSVRDIPVVEYQWRDVEPYYIVMNPNSGEREELKLDEWETRKKDIEEGGLPHFFRRRTVFRRAYFIGNEVVQEDASYPKGFTYKCITGKRDREKGYWFGLMRPLMDPQRWSNKWLSQILNIINANAKGGVMIEKSAMGNQSQFEKNWADPAGIVITADDALAGKRVLPKPMGQYPAGVERLMEYANDSFGDVSGINKELLGVADREQPGVLEYQRKQSAVTLLAPIFDSLTRFRKLQGRCWLYFMQNYVSDGRLIRIAVDEEEQFVPFIPDWFGADVAEYDVIVDQAATSPNQKEATWAVLTTILPAIKDMLGPEELMLALEYSPLPESFMAKLKGMKEEAAQQGPPPDPEMMKAQAQIQADQAKLQAQQQMEQTKIQSQIQLKQVETQAELERKRLEMEAEIELEREKTRAQIELEREKAQMNAEIQSFMAREKADAMQKQAKQAKSSNSKGAS